MIRFLKKLKKISLINDGEIKIIPSLFRFKNDEGAMNIHSINV